MIEVEAPAKLTLNLRVTGVRDDGYHLIDAEMVTLDFGDRLAIDPDGDGLEMVSAEGVESWDTLPKAQVARRLIERIADALPAR